METKMLVSSNPGQLPTDYQTFIHRSRYARFLDNKGRREFWDETVDRYLDYFGGFLEEHHSYKIPKILQSELRDAILNLAVVPSMRAMMTAGEAARRENMATYNCSYLEIDRPKAFAEVLYILMCGTGVGYSVERQVINRLPTVPNSFLKGSKTINVGDSKEGWAAAFLELIHSLYEGVVPQYDVSAVRPAGERLKVFGGRASGPGPLVELFEFTIAIFLGAKGRKLTSLECHDICTKTGDSVVVGGVRRSALISLSNLSDLRMREAKSGNWYDETPWRGLANNSVAYTEKPEPSAFMEEWLSLYRSKSGERGIFNRAGAIEKIKSLGRRNPNFEFGANPCAEIILRPMGLCNLTEVILRENDSPAEFQEKARLAAILGTFQSTQTNFQFVHSDWKHNAEEERLLGVSITGIYDNPWARGDEGHGKLSEILEMGRARVVGTNAELASELGINASVATTTIKPSGTVSQLALTSSGIHQGHAPHYIRRVSQDNKDPCTEFMKSVGIPNEPHVKHPEDMTVFEFPIKLGETTKTRDDVTAIQHMELVKLYNRHWSEHAVSCTISIKEEEWPSVGGWVYDNFEYLAGMSFLPHFEESTVYRQLPYQTISKEEYDRRLAAHPKNIDWTGLASFERGEDTVTGTREFACVGNTCEIVGKGTL
jgi:ribonucleoside-diphosphate reductase alpha chain